MGHFQGKVETQGQSLRQVFEERSKRALHQQGGKLFFTVLATKKEPFLNKKKGVKIGCHVGFESASALRRFCTQMRV